MKRSDVAGRWAMSSSFHRAIIAVFLLLASGCNSIMNGWLDPTVLGQFSENRTLEIRSTLTLEDSPSAIPGSEYPTLEDLEPQLCEFPITAGDTLAIEINELRQRQVPFATETQVATAGYVNLPILGRVRAAGLTVPQFEAALVQRLQDRSVLRDPEVVVNPLFLQKATYSIFGVGVSAATDAPLRAGVFPIRRPDLRLLEAINQVGGLNEFVTDVFIFRSEESCSPPTDWESASEPESRPSAERELSEHSTALGTPAPGTPAVQEVDRRSADEQEILDVLDRNSEKEPPPSKHQEKELDLNEDQRALIESVEENQTPPYRWENGEFVPNPAYHGSLSPTESPGSPLPAMETITPALNWARVAGDLSYRVIRIPADALRSGDQEVNVVIHAGDVLRVTSGEIGVYYVMGQANRVGPFAFNAERITLKAAIAAAGGLSGLAWPDRCTIYRRLGQREQMIQVNLDRIFAGRDADFEIRRGDIINVGTHPFAPFLQRIRGLTLPNPTTNVGYSFTYARNFADIDSYSVRQNPHNEAKKFPQLFP